jgi:hypothetical protein
MAARTAQLALLVDQLMPALRTKPPVLAGSFNCRHRAIVICLLSAWFVFSFGIWIAHAHLESNSLSNKNTNQTKNGNQRNNSHTTKSTSINLAPKERTLKDVSQFLQWKRRALLPFRNRTDKITPKKKNDQLNFRCMEIAGSSFSDSPQLGQATFGFIVLI